MLAINLRSRIGQRSPNINARYERTKEAKINFIADLV